MAHTFFLLRRFLSGLVSGGFGLFRGGNGLDSGLESSQGRWQRPERIARDVRIAWLDSRSGLGLGFFSESQLTLPGTLDGARSLSRLESCSYVPPFCEDRFLSGRESGRFLQSRLHNQPVQGSQDPLFPRFILHGR